MSLCVCGCGQSAPIARKTSARDGHVKGSPTRYIAVHQTKMAGARGGAGGRGRSKSVEHRAKIAAGKVAELNPNWKGDGALVVSIHDWLARNYPKRGICEECGHKRRTDHAFDHRLGEYTRDRADYRELCRSCHTLWDIEIGQRVA